MVFFSPMVCVAQQHGRPLACRLNCSLMRLPSLTVLCLALAVLLQPASAALARSGKQERRAAAEMMQTPSAAPSASEALRATTFTPDSAAREIQRMHGGRVLAVQADGAGYRVKMLKDGEVRIYQVDP